MDPKTDDFCSLFKKGRTKRAWTLRSFKMDLREIFQLAVVVGLIVGVGGEKLQASSTKAPTIAPTVAPTRIPTTTGSPTYEPTGPSMEPTLPVPSYGPTANPSCAPTSAPSFKPSYVPSRKPTPGPSSTIAPSSIDPTTREQWLYDQLTNFNSWLSPIMLATKYGAMDPNSFTFYRGTAHLMYRDIASETLPIPKLWSSTSNISSWCMGDGHIENVGYFNNGLTQDVLGKPSNNGLNGLVVFDVNDFDESWISPFYFDLIRGISGLYLDIDVINNITFWTNQTQARNLARQYVTTYFDAISSVNGNNNEVDSYMVGTLPPGTIAPKVVYDISANQFTGSNYIAVTALTSKYIEANTTCGSKTTMCSSTTVTNGQRAFTWKSKVTVVTSDRYKIDASWPMYLASLNQTFVTQKLKQNSNYFYIKSYANKLLSGIGSTGTRRYWLLIEGATSGVQDDVMLVMKEAIIPSMLQMGALGGKTNASLALFMKRYTLSNGAPNYGMHSAEGSRVMTAYLEPFTGYTVFNDGVGLGGSFTIRRSTPVATSFSGGDGNFPTLANFTNYAMFHARALAYSHARSDNDIRGGMVNYSVEAGIMNAVNGRWGGLTSVITQMVMLGENYVNQVRADFTLYQNLRKGLLWTNSPKSLTSAPSLVPTYAPTGPSFSPTLWPSSPPTFAPSPSPSWSPSFSPTKEPSFAPTPRPSLSPSFVPTKEPTCEPSLLPSMLPSVSPSQVPTLGPSFAPSLTPSASPTLLPSVAPSVAPSTPTSSPTFRPTPLPGAPTWEPTTAPSYSPTSSPTYSPSFGPSLSPSQLPSYIPTTNPSALPSQEPTVRPTYNPSLIPSTLPTFEPTTAFPTTTSAPTFTSAPTTANPSVDPTFAPSVLVTTLPTAAPSIEAAPTESSARPTLTAFPTAKPSVVPTVEAGAPTNAPTVAVVAYVTANQVFSGLTPEVAQSTAFKASVQSSVAFALNLDPSEVTINRVTLATSRRALLTVGDVTVSYTVVVVNADPVAVATTLQSPTAVAAVTVAMAVGGYAVTTQPPVTTVEKASPAPVSSPSSTSTISTTTLIGIVVGVSIGGVLLCLIVFFAVRARNNKRKQASAVAMARQSVLSNFPLGGTGTGPEAAFPVSMNPVFVSPRTEPKIKVDSLAPQVRNKVPWNDSPWVEESEVRESEMATPLPSGKYSRGNSLIAPPGRAGSAVIAPELHSGRSGSVASVISAPGKESSPAGRDSIPPAAGQGIRSTWDLNASL